MKRLFFYATLASGVVAAILMYRRGASVATIAQQTIKDPVGALTSELKAAL